MGRSGSGGCPRGVFRPVRKVNAASHVITQIQDLAASGHLNPGDRLPGERALAQALGVSRSTIREAIHSLEVLGLVAVRPAWGTVLIQRGKSRAAAEPAL